MDLKILIFNKKYGLGRLDIKLIHALHIGSYISIRLNPTGFTRNLDYFVKHIGLKLR